MAKTVIFSSDNFILKDTGKSGEDSLEVISCGSAKYYQVEIQISQTLSGEIDDIYVKQNLNFISTYGLKQYIDVLNDALDFIKRIYKQF